MGLVSGPLPACQGVLPEDLIERIHWRQCVHGYRDNACVLLSFGLGDLRRADVYGHHGMFPAFFATALGLVPKQVLQGRWVQIRACGL